jgi:mono/diheme cytochrome c family protein
MGRGEREADKHRKKLYALLSGLALLGGAALYAQYEGGFYSPATLGSISQPAGLAADEGSVYRVTDYTYDPPKLAPGPGREATEAYCSTCHSVRYITMQPPLPAATWAAEAEKMKNAFGMDIPQDSYDEIVKYLQTHYTPDTREN